MDKTIKYIVKNSKIIDSDIKKIIATDSLIQIISDYSIKTLIGSLTILCSLHKGTCTCFYL